jgi:hypothetical protein
VSAKKERSEKEKKNNVRFVRGERERKDPASASENIFHGLIHSE